MSVEVADCTTVSAIACMPISPSLRAFSTLTSGGLGVTFWLGALLIGSLLPLALEVVDLRRKSYRLTLAGSASGSSPRKACCSG